MSAIVVLSYNHPQITKKCIDSVLSQYDGKVYLVHNGSKLESVSELKTFFPSITHIECTKNREFSGGANLGINTAFENGAHQVLFLSNDTIVDSLHFDSSFENTERLSAVRVELRETKRLHSFGGALNLWTGTLSHFDNKLKSAENFYVPGSAFIVTKKAWEKLKGFDEELGSYWEDVDISLRAKKLGITLGFESRTVVKHGVAKTTGGNPLYTVYYYNRNRRRVCFRHGTWATRGVFAVAFTADSLGKLFNYAKRRDIKRLKLYLKALL